MDATTARRLLIAESRRLTLVREAIDDETGGGDGAASDLRGPDAAALTLEAEVTRSLRDAVDDERAEIAFALARVDHGTYGACVACAAPISEERLGAVPATRFCLSCEAAGEHRNEQMALPLVDHILRRALDELDGWTDDGAEEDEVVIPPAEEAAIHTRFLRRRLA